MSSKGPALKSLLLQAWRERWSEMKWSVNVKKALANNTDVNNSYLSELLLQQALVGSSPNMLILTYLKHAVSTKMVTYQSVIMGIVRYDDISKSYCIRSLLDVAHGFIGRISSNGNYEDTHMLAKSLVNLLSWLFVLIGKCLAILADGKMGAECQALLDKTCDVISAFLQPESNRALFHVGKLEEKDLFSSIIRSEHAMTRQIAQIGNANIISDELKSSLKESFGLLARVKDLGLVSRQVLDMSQHPLNTSINVLLSTEAVLYPTNDIQPLVEQLILIEKYQGLTRPVLYCEVVRSCWMGMCDSAQGLAEVKWAAFTFLKMPSALTKLIQQGDDKKERKVVHLEQGLERLLNYIPLLDLTDTKCNCNCLQYLLHELHSTYSLLSEQTCKKLMTRRKSESQKPKNQSQSPTTASTQPCVSLILRAYPTVTSILKTLDADYSKNQEALLGVLCHMMSGKSFELILAAAAATGKLQSFAVKLIKFNEFARQSKGEDGRGSQTRALLFDISFLMLCHITQLYGTEIVLSNPENSTSYFVSWALQCLPDEGKFKSLDMRAPPDTNKVDVLLNQVNPGGELVTSLTKWHEICHNLPYTIQEVLVAWEQGAITQEQVKTVMDNVKNKMCCLPVVVAAWLCSYINISSHMVRQKPISILQMLLVPASSDGSTSPTPQYFNERSNLAQIILTKMAQELLPSGSLPRTYDPLANYSIPPCTPTSEALFEVFREVYNRGCIDILSIHKLEYILGLCGAQWFCTQTVKEVLSQNRLEELSKGVGLIYSLSHIDSENLTLALLAHTVPTLLQAPAEDMKILTDPRGRCLAKLCVMCLSMHRKMKQLSKESGSPIKRGRKRTRTEIELEPDESNGDDIPPAKMRKFDDTLAMGTSDAFNLGDIFTSKEEAPSTAYDSKEPINKAMVSLFKLFGAILSYSQVSPKTSFVASFLDETLKCGEETARFILQFMPINMVSQLMKCLPSEFNTTMILHMCDLSTQIGRKVAAKAICQNAKFQKQLEAESL